MDVEIHSSKRLLVHTIQGYSGFFTLPIVFGNPLEGCDGRIIKLPGLMTRVTMRMAPWRGVREEFECDAFFPAISDAFQPLGRGQGRSSCCTMMKRAMVWFPFELGRPVAIGSALFHFAAFFWG